MASFFDNGVTTDASILGLDQSDLNKALSVGYGSNPAEFSGGRALVPEDLESTLTNILAEDENDCKVFASLHTQPVKSTVHEIVRRTGYGDHRFNFVGEGETAREDNQKLERKLFETKYIETLGSVTKQMEMVEGLENAYESEKIAAVNRVALTAERAMFHGNSAVNPKEYDGFEKIISDAAGSGQNNSTVVDIHGLEIGVTSTDTDLEVKDTGREMFNDIATKVFKKGGDLKRAFYAPELNMQFDRLYEDRLRYTNPGAYGMEYIPTLPTSIGSEIKIRGKDAGADKLYYVKGRVEAAGHKTLRPFAPSSVTADVTASASDSRFFSADAGVYTYVVHAINAAGISAGTTVSATATVTAGSKVTLTITANSDGPEATGFVICRSAADGSIVMEQTTIPANPEGPTTWVDLNTELPGTASMVLLSATESKGRNAISFGQLMPVTSIPLPMADNLSKRFCVALFGMLEVRNPEHHALIKNIGYHGGLYHN